MGQDLEEETYDSAPETTNDENEHVGNAEEEQNAQERGQEQQNEPVLDFEMHQKIIVLKKHVDWSEFSLPQKYIAFWKITGNTILQIQAKWKTQFQSFISGEAIMTCIKAIALSRTWKKGENGGNRTYLCKMDTQALVNELYERAHISDAFDTTSLLVFAGGVIPKSPQKSDVFPNSPQKKCGDFRIA